MSDSPKSEMCKVCGRNELEIVSVKEMRNGWREIHPYSYCKHCEFLELVEIPENIAKYYEQGYYTESKPYLKVKGLRALFWSVRAKLYDTFLHSIWNSFAFNTILDWKHRLGISFHAEILDYGCGNGDILYEFHKHGFKNLEGLDPFLPKTATPVEFPLKRGSIQDIQKGKKYNLIMMHHSFEHMPNQDLVLQSLKPHLSKGAKVLIRMPIVNEAFHHYREHWVQIDAPRHLGLHSEMSFKIMAEHCGYKVLDVFYDSTDFQFVGSEQNKADISFFEPKSIKINKANSIFTDEQLDRFNKKAEEYNKAGKGDQAGFILELK
jgi:2-polyprenyl-3-methyl-5-hydroxy-6-metoxy-1,4-benzoquinol methylase